MRPAAAAFAAIGVRRAFVVARTAGPVAAWLAAASIEVVEAETAPGAVIMAAVTGDLDGVPGVVGLTRGDDLEAALPAIRHLRDERTPLIVVVAPEPWAAATTDAAIRSAARRSPAVPAAIPPSPPDGSAGTAPPMVSGTSAARGTPPRPAALADILGQVTKGTAASVVEAAALAMTDPRGPVHVELSVFESAPAGDRAAPDAARFAPPPGARRASAVPASELLDEAVRHLTASARPVVLVGLQARSVQDAEWVRAFAEALPAPVVTTVRARGVLPEPHPLALGVLGRAADVLGRADLVVALGVEAIELDDVDWRSTAPVMQVTRSEAAVPFEHVVVTVAGDVALVLEELAPRLRNQVRADWDVAELDRMKRALIGMAPGIDTPSSPGTTAWLPRAVEVVARARALTPAGAIAVVEGRWAGACEAWQCVTPGDLLHPGPSGVPGFAVPAALAAVLARPCVPVVAFVDDEGEHAGPVELGTGQRLALSIVIVRLGSRPAPLVEYAEALGVSVITGPMDRVLHRAFASTAGRPGPLLLQLV